MADTKISALTELAATPATDDELAIVDTDASATKRISVSNLLAAAPAGDITQVDAGTNLSGGASSGVATVNLAIDSEVNFADNLATRPKLKDYSEHTNALGNTAATATIDLEYGNVITATLAVATTTFVFSNPIASDDASSFTLILAQDGTGSRIVTWPATVKWAGAAAPTLTTATTGIDVFAFTTIDGGDSWYGFTAGLAMA